jgi:group I intron endonuclease
MKGVIYCYHCISTGKKYIGQTLFEKRRKSYHKCCWEKIDTKFYRAVRKYGWENFIYGIVEEFDKEFLNEMEILYIEKFNSFKDGYNSTMGGEGHYGRIVSEDERIKSKNRMICNNPMKNEEVRKKVSKSLQGRKYSPEQIVERIQTRRNNSNEWHSKEMREKMSAVMKTKTGEKNSRYGKSHTEETKKIMSDKKIGNTNVRGKKWWNDGQNNTMSLDCPGEQWSLGRCKKK